MEPANSIQKRSKSITFNFEHLLTDYCFSDSRYELESALEYATFYKSGKNTRYCICNAITINAIGDAYEDFTTNHIVVFSSQHRCDHKRQWTKSYNTQQTSSNTNKRVQFCVGIMESRRN